MLKILTLLTLCFSTAFAKDTSPLPDGEVTSQGGYSARLIAPTKRYAHGVLGDAIEAGGFELNFKGKTYRYYLEENAVFEDRRVRLIPQTNQAPLMLIIKSYLDKGSSLALYELKDDKLVIKAETPAIGTPNRWLNIVGIDDYVGNNSLQIAAVLMPHIRGSLRLYSLPNLSEISSLEGYTNHIIGESNLDLGRSIRFNQKPSLLLPTVSRNALALIQVNEGRLQELKRFPFSSRIKSLATIKNNKATVTLENGQQMTVDLGR